MASYQVNPLEILDSTNSTGVGSGGSLTVGGGMAVGMDLYVGGNVSISGTTTSFADNIIIINAGATTSQDTGILLNRASSDVSDMTSANYSSIIYSELGDEFRFGYASEDTRGNLTINSYLPVRTGGVNIIGGSLNATYDTNTIGNIFTTGGNVGIGTTSPTYILDIGGTSRVDGDLEVIGNLNVTGALNYLDLTFQTSSNILTGNITTTNLIFNHSTAQSLIISETATVANLNVTGTMVFSTLDNVESIGATNTTFVNILNTSMTTGTVRSSLISSANISVSLMTSGTALITNISNTSLTSGTLRATTLISSANISMGRGTINNLSVNTLVSASNVIVTNLTNTNSLFTNTSISNLTVDNLTGSEINVSTSTVANMIISSYIKTPLIEAITYTGANMSLSGDLNIGGSIVSTFTTNANYINTNTTTDTLLVNVSMSAIGDFNTIGNVIYTTGGNVGIGTVSPIYLLDVNGNARYTGSVTMANLEVGGLADIPNISNSNLSNTAITTGTLRVRTLATMGQLNSLNLTVGNIRANVSISTGQLSILNVTAGTIRATTLITTANISVVNITSSNFRATRATTSSLVAGDATITTLNIQDTLGVDATYGTVCATTGITTGILLSTEATIGSLNVNTYLNATGLINTFGSIVTTGDGHVGIGTSEPLYQLELSTDSAAKPSTNTWTVSSDERLKTNIELANLEMCYNTVKNIPLKKYKWRDDVYTNDQVPDRSKLGWIAQDVEQLIPKAVEKRDMLGYSDCRTLNSDQIIANLYGCVQKLMKDIELLKEEVEIIKESSVNTLSVQTSDKLILKGVGKSTKPIPLRKIRH